MMNKKSFLIYGTLLVSTAGFSPQFAQASIFKCVNEQGAVFYNDKPCPIKDKETKFRSVKDPKNALNLRLPNSEKEETDHVAIAAGHERKVIDKVDAVMGKSDEIVGLDDMGKKRAKVKEKVKEKESKELIKSPTSVMPLSEVGVSKHSNAQMLIKPYSKDSDKPPGRIE